MRKWILIFLAQGQNKRPKHVEFIILARFPKILDWIYLIYLVDRLKIGSVKLVPGEYQMKSIGQSCHNMRTGIDKRWCEEWGARDGGERCHHLNGPLISLKKWTFQIGIAKMVKCRMGNYCPLLYGVEESFWLSYTLTHRAWGSGKKNIITLRAKYMRPSKMLFKQF